MECHCDSIMKIEDTCDNMVLLRCEDCSQYAIINFDLVSRKEMGEFFCGVGSGYPYWWSGVRGEDDGEQKGEKPLMRLCPFCGARPVLKMSPPCQVRCPDCNLKGPKAAGQSQAIKKWDRLRIYDPLGIYDQEHTESTEPEKPDTITEEEFDEFVQGIVAGNKIMNHLREAAKVMAESVERKQQDS